VDSCAFAIDFDFLPLLPLLLLLLTRLLPVVTYRCQTENCNAVREEKKMAEHACPQSYADAKTYHKHRVNTHAQPPLYDIRWALTKKSSSRLTQRGHFFIRVHHFIIAGQDPLGRLMGWSEFQFPDTTFPNNPLPVVLPDHVAQGVRQYFQDTATTTTAAIPPTLLNLDLTLPSSGLDDEEEEEEDDDSRDMDYGQKRATPRKQTSDMTPRQRRYDNEWLESTLGNPHRNETVQEISVPPSDQDLHTAPWSPPFEPNSDHQMDWGDPAYNHVYSDYRDMVETHDHEGGFDAHDGEIMEQGLVPSSALVTSHKRPREEEEEGVAKSNKKRSKAGKAAKEASVTAPVAVSAPPPPPRPITDFWAIMDWEFNYNLHELPSHHPDNRSIVAMETWCGALRGFEEAAHILLSQHATCSKEITTLQTTLTAELDAMTFPAEPEDDTLRAPSTPVKVSDLKVLLTQLVSRVDAQVAAYHVQCRIFIEQQRARVIQQLQLLAHWSLLRHALDHDLALLMNHYLLALKPGVSPLFAGLLRNHAREIPNPFKVLDFHGAFSGSDVFPHTSLDGFGSSAMKWMEGYGHVMAPVLPPTLPTETMALRATFKSLAAEHMDQDWDILFQQMMM
jgi:hypothetical protein